jgi:hypothetical protein
MSVDGQGSPWAHGATEPLCPVLIRVLIRDLEGSSGGPWLSSPVRILGLPRLASNSPLSAATGLRRSWTRTVLPHFQVLQYPYQRPKSAL